MEKMVFVLEDNEDIRELFTIILEEESFNVFAFANIKLFNQKISTLLPDVIILDVMLPDGNGADVCCSLKSSARTAGIPVMMVSANFGLAEISKVCQADDFLSKPFDINQFIGRVKGLVS